MWMKSVQCGADQKLPPSLATPSAGLCTPPSLTKEEAECLGRGGQQHVGRHLAHHTPHMFLNALILQPWFTLPCLHQNEDVVHAHRQHQEGNHLPRKEGMQLSVRPRLDQNLT